MGLNEFLTHSQPVMSDFDCIQLLHLGLPVRDSEKYCFGGYSAMLVFKSAYLRVNELENSGTIAKVC